MEAAAEDEVSLLEADQEKSHLVGVGQPPDLAHLKALQRLLLFSVSSMG